VRDGYKMASRENEGEGKREGSETCNILVPM
jgi:hypothetical protein